MHQRDCQTALVGSLVVYEFGVVVGGRAVVLGRTCLLLPPTLFEILVSEEICGRFGSVRWIRRLYIAPVGFRSDDLVSASLFDVVFCYLWIT